jgi:hypothetical protein
MTNLCAIAPGYNNTAGLTLIQDLVSFEGEAFNPPSMYGTYNPGQFRIRGDGTIIINGYPSCAWLFSMITWGQIAYLNRIYCNGQYSGKVTLKTRTDDPLVWGVFNAVMTLEKLTDSRKNYGWQEDWIANFTRMVAL